jgi:carbonic anhydrase
MREAPVTAIDDLVANNEKYATSFPGGLPGVPVSKVAVLACMDARLHVHELLGLDKGDAQVISNAGGVVTDDAIRSLSISQRLLGTREVMLIHHTDCGLLKFTDEEFTQALVQDTGLEPPWTAQAFSDLDDDVRVSIARIKESPFVPHTDQVRGFVFDVEAGTLREVV